MAKEGLPHAVDIHVGARIRQKRKEMGMSQEVLATQLDLTFQQVQKYERGANRVSASKLHEIAVSLKTPITYFFAGYGEDAPGATFMESDAERTVSDFLMTSEGIELAETFPRIKNPKLRRRVVELTKALAEAIDD